MKQLDEIKNRSIFIHKVVILNFIMFIFILFTSNSYASNVYKYESTLMYDPMYLLNNPVFTGTEHFTLYFTIEEPTKEQADSSGFATASGSSWGTWYSEDFEAQLSGSVYVYGGFGDWDYYKITGIFTINGTGLSPYGEILHVEGVWPFDTYMSRGGYSGRGYCESWSVVGNVPEPTSMLLFGLGLIGLAGVRRKIQK